MRDGTVIGPCLACGAACTSARVYSGVVGPFCTVKCRDKQEDTKLWERANAYAGRVKSAQQASGAPMLEEVDVARAFVIGFASGCEYQAGQGRRTVKQ